MSSLPGAASGREPLPQRADDLVGLVHGERGLHEVGDLGRVRRGAGGRRRRRSPPGPWPSGRLAQRALDLLVAGVADQRHQVARPRRTGAPRRAPWTPAGRWRRWRPARAGRVAPHRRGDAVRGEHHARPVRHLVSSSTKTAPRRSRSATTWVLCTICLRTYTGGPCRSSGPLDDLDRPLHPGAERPRPGEQHPPLAGRRGPPGQGRARRPAASGARASPPASAAGLSSGRCGVSDDGPDHRHRPPAGRRGQPRRLQVDGQRARVRQPAPAPGPGQPLRRSPPARPLTAQPGPRSSPASSGADGHAVVVAPSSDLGGHHQVTGPEVIGQPPPVPATASAPNVSCRSRPAAAARAPARTH